MLYKLMTPNYAPTTPSPRRYYFLAGQVMSDDNHDHNGELLKRHDVLQCLAREYHTYSSANSQLQGVYNCMIAVGFEQQQVDKAIAATDPNDQYSQIANKIGITRQQAKSAILLSQVDRKK